MGGAILKRGGATVFSRLALGSYSRYNGMRWGCSWGWTLLDTCISGVVIAMSISHFIGGLGNGGVKTATLVVVVVIASSEDQAVATACVYSIANYGWRICLTYVPMYRCFSILARGYLEVS